jgi:hypothetical protein
MVWSKVNGRSLVTPPWPQHMGLSTQQKQVDKIVEEYIRYIFTSPIGVPLHYQVKHSIDLIPGAPLPNGPIYRCSLLENEEIKCQIHELIQKGHIQPSSSPCGSPIVLVQKKDGTWRLYVLIIEP